MSEERLTTDQTQVPLLDPAAIGTLRFPVSSSALTSGQPTMRFVCDSCRAQYMISDDKVGAKGVKVRCKKCGYVILVRRAAAAAPMAAPPPPQTALGDEGDSTATQVMDNPLGGLPPPGQNFDPDSTSPSIAVSAKGNGANGTNGRSNSPVFGSVPDDEISSVFDQVLNSGHHKVPDENSEGPQALGGEPDDRMSTRVLDADTVQKLAAETNAEAKNGEGKNGENHNDWFVAVDEKQVGPLNVDKIKAMWDRGEIGPDSLCWRAGFSDWTALSEVPQLATTLAPKPQKPVIVAPAAMGMPSVMTVPVESAFSAGGMTRTVRSEVPMLAGAPGAQSEAGWRPSAASALQSLVKEEIEALTKPAPKAASAAPMVMDDKPKSQALGLLDVPDATPSRGNGKVTAAVAEAQAPQFAQPFQAQYPIYRPSDDSSKKLMMIGGLVGIVLLLALVGLVGYLMASRNSPAPQPIQGQMARAEQPPAPPAVVAQKAVTPAPEAAKVAPGTATPPPVAVAPAPPPAAHTVEAPPPGHTRSSSSNSESGTHRSSSGTSGGDDTHNLGSPTKNGKEKSGSHDSAEPTKVAAAEKGGSSDDDEFSRTFGGGNSGKSKTVAKAEPSEGPAKKKGNNDVYIPPAPGSGGDIPDQVGQGDIMATVVSQKPAIIDCVNKQKAKDADAHGTLVMRWTIQNSGRVQEHLPGFVHDGTHQELELPQAQVGAGPDQLPVQVLTRSPPVRG
jgi:predicted Zn finger-like uncharacterized protein